MRNKVLVVGGKTATLLTHRGSFIQALVSTGIQVVCVGVEKDERVEKWMAGLGVQWEYISLSRTTASAFADMMYIWRLCRIIREQNPTTIVAYTHKVTIYCGFARALARTQAPVTALVTGLGYAFGDSDSLRRRASKLAIVMLYKLSRMGIKRWIFQNRDDMAEFQKQRIIRSRDPVIVVDGSGVDLQVFAKREAPTSKKLNVLFVSRMLVEKGIRDLINAIAILRAQGTQVDCTLVGEIDENPSAISKDEVLLWERDGLVHYAGYRTDVHTFLESCSVVVLPSYYREGVPRVLLEALATGRPIITTGLVGCKEAICGTVGKCAEGVLRAENGFVVEPKDGPAIARALALLAQDPTMRHEMGCASRKLAETRFDAAKINAAMITFICN